MLNAPDSHCFCMYSCAHLTFCCVKGTFKKEKNNRHAESISIDLPGASKNIILRCGFVSGEVQTFPPPTLVYWCDEVSHKLWLLAWWFFGMDCLSNKRRQVPNTLLCARCGLSPESRCNSWVKPQSRLHMLHSQVSCSNLWKAFIDPSHQMSLAVAPHWLTDHVTRFLYWVSASGPWQMSCLHDFNCIGNALSIRFSGPPIKRTTHTYFSWLHWQLIDHFIDLRTSQPFLKGVDILEELALCTKCLWR